MSHFWKFSKNNVPGHYSNNYGTKNQKKLMTGSRDVLDNAYFTQTAKMAKKGQKIVVFGPPGPNFAKIEKKAWTFSYFYPREAVYQISENLAHQTWRKCVTNERTDGRTDGRD